MVVLRVIELGGRQNLGGDGAVARRLQPLLECVAGSFRRLALLVAVTVDAGAILRADIVALAHALRRIVVLPENLQQIVVADCVRVEDHEHDLGVCGHAGADFAVGRIRGMAGGVSDGRAVHPGELPEFLLGAPKAAHCEHRLGEALGKGRHDPVPIDEMHVWDGHAFSSTGERPGG